MIRLFEKNLAAWKNSGMKKPLMVIGVRQIGKTYTIEKFAKENFEEYIYINLEKEKDIAAIFEETIDDERIMEKLELYYGRKIDLDKTIFFFDEVQVSERFIVSLKYFCESPRPYKIVCAGSLLGVKISRFHSSFPVGKVRMEYMHPMNFEEFLTATGHEMLRDRIKECYKKLEPIPDFAHEKALELYRKYLCVGGMPESVKNLIENDMDILKYDSNILLNIVEMYIADMQKYVNNNVESVKIEKVYKSIPAQLAKDKKTFQYNLIEEGARKRKYETPIDWLISSDMIAVSSKVKKPEIPLKVYVDDEMFKLYLSDVGLLSTVTEINYPDVILDRPFEYKGAITENYIAEEFKARDISLYYWTYGRNAKVDFVIYNNDGIIPVEVKSGSNTKSTSLNIYMKEHKPKYAIRFSTRNFGFENNIKSIPLYAAFCVE